MGSDGEAEDHNDQLLGVLVKLPEPVVSRMEGSDTKGEGGVEDRDVRRKSRKEEWKIWNYHPTKDRILGSAVVVAYPTLLALLQEVC